MVYVKHFDILGIDTAQIPCIELQGVPNTATVGAVGLLGMDVTSEGKEIYVCTGVNGAIYTWKCLKDGKDGVCVVKSEINGNGELILTLSDGNTLNAGVAKGEKGEPGKDGKDGKDGKSIQETVIIDGVLLVRYTDGTQDDLGKVTGENGVSIVKTEVNVNNELIITLSNDTVINAGEISVADNIISHLKKELWVGESYGESDEIILSENLNRGDEIEITFGEAITGGWIHKARAVYTGGQVFDTPPYDKSCYLYISYDEKERKILNKGIRYIDSDGNDIAVITRVCKIAE